MAVRRRANPRDAEPRKLEEEPRRAKTRGRAFKRRFRYGTLFGFSLGILVVALLQHHGYLAVWKPYASQVAEMAQEMANDISNTLTHMSKNEILKEYAEAFDRFSVSFNQTRHDVMTRLFGQSENVRPGLALAKEGFTAKYPVVIVPGLTSTRLELWKGKACAETHFRLPLWSSTMMIQQFLVNQKCWLEHLMMNLTTGLDPEGIKVRAAEGISAADFIVGNQALGGYWVWAKIIENLADIGYDVNSIIMAPYDWRLSCQNLEIRDAYFSKLKSMIELTRRTRGNKVVAITHSNGGMVWHYFMKWVEHAEFGGGGQSWVKDHIQSIIHVAVPYLGVSKAVSSLLSGEMKDTANLGLFQSVLDFKFSPGARRDLLRSWLSVGMLLPRGGNRYWGNERLAPDDFLRIQEKVSVGDSEPASSAGALITFTDSNDSYTANEVLSLLRGTSSSDALRLLASQVDMGDGDGVPKDDIRDNPRYWTSTLVSPLPEAPDLQIYCLYGVKNPTERSYFYKRNPNYVNRTQDDGTPQQVQDETPFVVDTSVDRPPWVTKGVHYSDGDGTVPLLSLGYMCVHGWNNPILNPSKTKIVTREYEHDPVPVYMDPRGGPRTGDHVDILGNSEFIKDILLIVSGERVEQRVVSGIEELQID